MEYKEIKCHSLIREEKEKKRKRENENPRTNEFYVSD